MQLERGETGDTEPTFTAIAQITNLSGPEIERETYDVTAHDSPSGWREYIGGLKDGGEMTAEVNYDPDEHDTLIEDFEDTDARDYRVVFPGGAQWEIKAFLTGFSQESPVDDKMSAELTFQVVGKPEITAAGS